MKNKKLFQALVKISLLSTILAMSFQVLPTQAAALTALKDTMTRLKISTAANHAINYTTTNALAATDTIVFNFDPTGMAFNLGALAIGDMATTGMTLVAACAGATDEVTVAVTADPDLITLTVCAGDTVAAGAKTLALNNGIVINPAAAGSYVISVTTKTGGVTTLDSGSITIPIVDSDQVVITAQIDALLTFDLDTNTTAWTGGDDAAPYSVNLGTLTAGAVATSADGGTVNYIYVDLATNGIGGAVITVRDVGDGAAGGLYSASRLKNILSGTAVLSPGTEGYGICVRQTQATSGSFVGTGVYNTLAACATHSVGALSLTPTDILNTAGAPATGGRAQILVKAAINSLTPAATDYTDTLTFIATSTF